MPDRALSLMPILMPGVWMALFLIGCQMNLVVLRTAEWKLVYLLMGLSTCQVLWHSWDGCALTRLG